MPTPAVDARWCWSAAGAEAVDGGGCRTTLRRQVGPVSRRARRPAAVRLAVLRVARRWIGLWRRAVPGDAVGRDGALSLKCDPIVMQTTRLGRSTPQAVAHPGRSGSSRARPSDFHPDRECGALAVGRRQGRVRCSPTVVPAGPLRTSTRSHHCRANHSPRPRAVERPEGRRPAKGVAQSGPGVGRCCRAGDLS